MAKKYIFPESRPHIPWDPNREYPTILELIRSYSESETYSLHMPGHKRNTQKFGSSLPYALDMTESIGMANLHDPADGIIERKQNELAKEFGAFHSFFMINGSSGGILAGLRTLTERGDRIVVARNCHKSAYHAIELCQLNPIYVLPEVDQKFGIYGSIDPDTIEKTLEANPETTVVLITSPNFDGVLSDVRSIANICHEHGVLLMVDEAHGAHLHYMDEFEDSVSCGADLVIQSLHKTLPALTSTSVAHISNRVDPYSMARNLSIFETTSPNHILLASIDECLEYMYAEGRSQYEWLHEVLAEISEKFNDLQHLQVYGMGEDREEDHPNCFMHDPTKIVISTFETNIYGKQLIEELRKRHFELEMCYGNYVLAMVTLGDTEEGLLSFADALLEIDAALSEESELDAPIFPDIPEKDMLIYDTLEYPHKEVSLQDSIGRISHEYIWAYPPGIPLLVPGERIDEAMISRMNQLTKQGITLKSSSHGLPDVINVIG
ncbi:aminotransferase class I/II-fold pyridoxal phosphate-dependent enzyme [Peptoniphilaceae bacterium SGI.137]|nr:aminotransferase class V-fold PLP-dependent enzyme [Peptoniphilaceae bacterium]MDY3987427.1 aminotransferase class V-fold PLP-dependent enzyme [Peptoniphilaceae bacterium]MDY4196596.1 aminotransferase class V-fold PLP-dependent enzyme [Peptoniphilaceae bacterium]MDY5842249.1 aminotransferase class V-fold PLP-dependent enzyme [Peptoniphilaceae bacterium]